MRRGRGTPILEVEWRRRRFVEPVIEKSAEFLAADLFGKGDEVRRGGIAMTVAFRPGLEECEEGVVSDGDPERVEGQGSAAVDGGG